jgi:hypothetical protein
LNCNSRKHYLQRVNRADNEKGKPQKEFWRKMRHVFVVYHTEFHRQLEPITHHLIENNLYGGANV